MAVITNPNLIPNTNPKHNTNLNHNSSPNLVLTVYDWPDIAGEIHCPDSVFPYVVRIRIRTYDGAILRGKGANPEYARTCPAVDIVEHTGITFSEFIMLNIQV